MEYVHVRPKNTLTLLVKPAETAILLVKFVQLQGLTIAKLAKTPLNYKLMEVVNVQSEHIWIPSCPIVPLVLLIATPVLAPSEPNATFALKDISHIKESAMLPALLPNILACCFLLAALTATLLARPALAQPPALV